MTCIRKMINENKKHIVGTRIDAITYVIAPLLKDESTIGKGLPPAMILNDNAIDYVHWDDPNELVDRMRLLEASPSSQRA